MKANYKALRGVFLFLLWPFPLFRYGERMTRGHNFIQITVFCDPKLWLSALQGMRKWTTVYFRFRGDFMAIFSRFYCEFPLCMQPFLVFLPRRNGTSYQMILELKKAPMKWRAKFYCLSLPEIGNYSNCCLLLLLL